MESGEGGRGCGVVVGETEGSGISSEESWSWISGSDSCVDEGEEKRLKD